LIPATKRNAILTAMKLNNYFLASLFLISLVFLLPSLSLAQGLAPIPDVGEGVCVANCGGETMSSPPQPEDDTELPDPSDTSSVQLSIILSNIKTVASLESQALKKISQKQYTEAETLINNSISALVDAKNTLNTDPELEDFRSDKPQTVSKIIRAIDKSLNSLQKSSLLIVRVNDSGTEESLLSKLIKGAKKFLQNSRRNTIRVTNAVAGVRG